MDKRPTFTTILVISILFALVVSVSPTTNRARAQGTLIPVTITITDVWDINEGDGIGQGCPDFFTLLEVNDTGPRQSSTVQGGAELSGCGGGYHILPPSDWEVTELIPLQQRTAKVSIEIWDEDSSSPNDHTDIDPGPGIDIEFDVDVRNGTWTGEGVQNPPKVEFPGTGCLSGRANGSSTGVGDGSVGVCWFVKVGPDTDGDGLLDHWETDGYFADADNIVDVDLPRMGANPLHKDLFLELDWMSGVSLTRRDILRMKDAFDEAPINSGRLADKLQSGSADDPNTKPGIVAPSNPDGLRGINLHIDTGNLSDPTASEDASVPGSCLDGMDNGRDGNTDANDPDCLVGDNLGNLGQGNMITHMVITSLCSLASNDLDGNGIPDFYDFKAIHFAQARHRIFRYGISAISAGPQCTGGQAEIGGNDFVEFNHDGAPSCMS